MCVCETEQNSWNVLILPCLPSSDWFQGESGESQTETVAAQLSLEVLFALAAPSSPPQLVLKWQNQ